MLSEQAISHTARALSEAIERTLPDRPSEADFRRPLDRILEEFCQQIALTTKMNEVSSHLCERNAIQPT